MSKIISVLALVSLLALPVMVLAVSPPPEVTGCTMRHDLTGTGWTDAGFTCPGAGSLCDFGSTTETCGACCMLDTIYTITDWIFIIVTAFAIIMIIIGAFTIITAGGAPEKVTSGRNYILYAAVGMVVGLAARAIPALARAILGV